MHVWCRDLWTEAAVWRDSIGDEWVTVLAVNNRERWRVRNVSYKRRCNLIQLIPPNQYNSRKPPCFCLTAAVPVVCQSFLVGFADSLCGRWWEVSLMMVIMLALSWGGAVFIFWWNSISPALSLVALLLMLTDSDLLAPSAAWHHSTPCGIWTDLNLSF